MCDDNSRKNAPKMKHMSHVAPQPASTELVIMFSMEITECAHEIVRPVVPATRDIFEMNKEIVSMKDFVLRSNSLNQSFLTISYCSA